MKKDLNKNEIKELENAIRKFIKSRSFESSKYSDRIRFSTTFKQLDNIIGLAYTSSGCYAGLFICNVTLYFDIEGKYKINGFGMCSDGRCFADIFNIENGIGTFYIYI